MLWTVTEVQRVIKTLYISNVKLVDIKKRLFYFYLYGPMTSQGKLDSTVQNNTKKRNAKGYYNFTIIKPWLIFVRGETGCDVFVQ